ncbi:MAG TPA: SCO family protein [Candidatus Sulfotelmatobacter sp.]|nr:SCO family protein [Candidatus Sulfotelmatobacter sp.]
MSCKFGLAITLLLAATASRAQMAPDNVGPSANGMPTILQGVGFRPELNAQMPLDTPFKDEAGKDVRLGDYFHQQKPVLVAFVYYGCPMMCTQLEQGVVGALRMLSFNPARDYEVVFISFDERDTVQMAAEKKATAMSKFRRPETATGWHFLTGSKESITAATNAANFHFNFDAKNNLFAHASGLLLLTPDGHISRYFYGVEFSARDIRLGLVDASAGKIGTPVDHVLLYCFQYDPSTARYSATILGIVRLGGVLTIAAMLLAFLIFRRRDHAAARANLRHQGAH